MPELPEVEKYRVLAERALGRAVASVSAPDAWFLKDGLTAPVVESVLPGLRFTAARRRGKLLLLDTDGDHVLGLRFGMSGRLLVDGHAAIDDYAYASMRDEPAWDRFSLTFEDGGDLRMRDPRRLGGVALDPDEDKLGHDALTVTRARLRDVLRSDAPLKARLLDQAKLAGVGNLLADEALWRAGIDPARPARSLTDAEVRRLHTHLVATIRELSERGGSHMGDLQPARVRGGVCPRDGAPLLRRTVGGRTTFSCPKHQR